MIFDAHQPAIIMIRLGDKWVRRAGYNEETDRAQTIIYPDFNAAWREVHDMGRYDSLPIHRIIMLQDKTKVHFWGIQPVMIQRRKRV